MISELLYLAIKVLSYIFNAIFRMGYFPPIWKISLIIMIPKVGKDLTNCSSYRPISLTPSMSKLFERVLLAKLQKFLETKNVIPHHQFGFRAKHGTIEQVNRITNEIRRTFEEKKYCSAVFLDVAQAFDKVWHAGLIHKIKKFLPSNTHEVLVSYLSDRKFRVKYKDFVTTDHHINAGVTQGSVLGPILYLLYTCRFTD